jgi:hypothetical protein
MSFDINKLRKLQNASNTGTNASTQAFIKEFDNYINSEEFENFLQTAITNRILKEDTPKIYCGLPKNKYNRNVFVICESQIVDATPINGKVFNFGTIVHYNVSDEVKKSVINVVDICYEMLVNKLKSLGIQVITQKQNFKISDVENDSHVINLVI